MPQLGLFGKLASRERKAPSGPHAEACRGWSRLWFLSRRVEYAWSGADRRGVQLGLKQAGGDVQLWLDRARGLLFDPPDAWYAQNASPMILSSRWNQLGARVSGPRNTRDSQNMQALARALEVL